MTKVLVATEKPFAKSAVDAIKQVLDKAGFETILLENYSSALDFVNAVADVDAVIIRSDIASKEVIDAGKNLKIIVRAGAGYDNIDLKAASDKGVVAMNTPGQNSNAVAELALGMMVYMARSCFNGKSGTELKGKNLGIHAFGWVGKNIARIAQGFDMNVIVFDPFVKQADFPEVKFVSTVEELYSSCQYISLNIPANDKTKKSINAKLLSTMPKGAILVNTARKEVIDEADLLKIFAERPDFKYISDVAPDCAAEIASNFEGRFFFTPKKMGAQTSEANNNAGIAAAKQIVAYIKDGDATYKVN